MWAVAELASYAAAGSDSYTWDYDAALGVLRSLLPIAGYVAAPIALSVVAFWALLARDTGIR
jgi:hypothetical protein